MNWVQWKTGRYLLLALLSGAPLLMHLGNR